MIQNCLPKFNLCAPIEKALPSDVLQFALCYIPFKDKGSTILVSQYWRYLTLESVRLQDDRIVQVFEERMMRPYKALGSATTLAQCNQMLLERLKEVVESLTLLSIEELKTLEVSFRRIKKPPFFESVFEIARLHREYDQLVADEVKDDTIHDDLTGIAYKLCTLGSLEKALKGAKTESVRCWNLVYTIAAEYCKNRKPDKALDVAKRLHFPDGIKIMIKLFGMGAVEEGKALGNTLMTHPDVRIDQYEKFLSMLSTMKNGKFENFNEYVYLSEYNDFFQDAVLESANNLIREQNFTEALVQAKRLEFFRRRKVDDSFVAKYIELDKWNEVTGDMVHVISIASTITALCSRGKFTEAHKICTEHDIAIVDIHKFLRDQKFDDVMTLAKKIPFHECKLSVAKKLAEQGQLEKAYQIIGMISDLTFKHQALKHINHYLEG